MNLTLSITLMMIYAELIFSDVTFSVALKMRDFSQQFLDFKIHVQECEIKYAGMIFCGCELSKEVNKGFM